MLKIKRAETPFYSRLKRMIQSTSGFRLPVPRFMFPVLSVLYNAHFAVIGGARYVVARLYREPLFRSQCDAIGKGLYLEQLPFVSGNVVVRIGNNVTISGDLTVNAGRTHDKPELIIGNDVFIGHRVVISVGQRIVIEEGVAIAGGCYIADNDNHPNDLEARIRKEPPPAEEILPVRIGRNAWIGRGSYIMKGVTVGEGAVVGAGSVVIADVPPFSIAMGSPARLVPSRKAAATNARQATV